MGPMSVAEAPGARVERRYDRPPARGTEHQESRPRDTPFERRGRVEERVEEIWRHVDDTLRSALPADVHRVWIEPLRAVAAQDGVLYLRVSPASKEWVQRRFGGVLEAAACVDDAIRRIELVTADHPPAISASNVDLKPAYTFDRFVIGSGNRFAHAAALAVAELPGQVYNPLFMWGPPGVGKTHLLQAIGNYVTLCVKGLSVRYASAETFTSHFLTALQRKQVPSFKQRYRAADMLLLDDVQFLESKDKTAEEFLYTLDAVLNAGGQVILSADRPPAAMPQLHARLKGRFESGLLVDVGGPDLPARLAILRKHAGPDAGELEKRGVLELLAERLPTNVRALESALVRTRAYASLTQQPLTLELAEHVLSAIAPTHPERPGSVSVQRILDLTSRALALEPTAITSTRRSRQVVYARQVAMYLCRELTDHSLPAIARQFGGKDHTTVLHAHRKLKREIVVDPSTRELVDRLVRDIHDA
jgi:chromosomal replication initiator protein